MKRLVLLVAVGIPALFLLSSALLGAADITAGKEAYLKKCANCHGQAGEGKDAIAQMLKIKFIPLGSKEVQSKNDAELKKIPLEGKGKMNAVKDLNDQMIEDIIAFVRTLAKK